MKIQTSKTQVVGTRDPQMGFLVRKENWGASRIHCLKKLVIGFNILLPHAILSQKSLGQSIDKTDLGLKPRFSI